MRIGNFVAPAIGAFALVFITGAWACGGADSNRHAGVILGVVEAGQSFTILDMESNRPITFLADDTLISRVSEAKGRVLVEFDSDGANLTATDVRF